LLPARDARLLEIKLALDLAAGLVGGLFPPPELVGVLAPGPGHGGPGGRAGLGGPPPLLHAPPRPPGGPPLPPPPRPRPKPREREHVVRQAAGAGVLFHLV